MQIVILTIFPDMITNYLSQSILGKAQELGHYELKVVNIRDFTTDKHHKTDDEPFGGGAGMVMSPEPLFKALESLDIRKDDRVIFPLAQGRIFDQPLAKEFAKEERLIFVCGRYEGIDQRVIKAWATDKISIGQYVLTGGELPTLTIIDATLRMIEGVVGKQESIINESFFNGEEYDYPQYTRPANFRGLKVPEVLLNGNHKDISNWQNQNKLKLET